MAQPSNASAIGGLPAGVLLDAGGGGQEAGAVLDAVEPADRGPGLGLGEVLSGLQVIRDAGEAGGEDQALLAVVVLVAELAERGADDADLPAAGPRGRPLSAVAARVRWLIGRQGHVEPGGHLAGLLSPVVAGPLLAGRPAGGDVLGGDPDSRRRGVAGPAGGLDLLGDVDPAEAVRQTPGYRLPSLRTTTFAAAGG